MLPYAIQYGMSPDEFWHEDKRLFDAYQKAYVRKSHETAWLNGLYVNVAIQNTVANIFAKKGSKPHEYPSAPIDPFKEKKVYTPEKVSQEYGETLKKQNDFIRSLMQK